jgi:hypothetical protein
MMDAQVVMRKRAAVTDVRDAMVMVCEQVGPVMGNQAISIAAVKNEAQDCQEARTLS